MSITEVVQHNEGTQKKLFLQDMDLVGDTTGSINMNVNGSVTPVYFFVKPSGTQILRVSRAILLIKDSSSLDSGGWGNNGGLALTNGIEFGTQIAGVDYPFGTFKTHARVAGVTHDLEKRSWGAGDEFITARWTFTKFGQYLRLRAEQDESLYLKVQDDLTYIVEQIISIQGYYERE